MRRNPERAWGTTQIIHGGTWNMKAALSFLKYPAWVLVASCLSCTTKAQMQGSADYQTAPTYNYPTTSASTSPVTSDGGSATVVRWPLEFSNDGMTYTLFQPQSDSWDGHLLRGRSAVSVQGQSQSQPVYGTINFTAITLVDKTAHTARLANIKVNSANFPSATANA